MVPDAIREELQKPTGGLPAALRSGLTVFLPGKVQSYISGYRTMLSRQGWKVVCRTTDVDGVKGIVVWLEAKDAA